MNSNNYFISPQEAFFLQQNSQVIFIDSSFKRSDSSNPFEEFLNCHISNSLFFDISQFSLKDSLCPPMLTDIDSFNESCSSLGISNEDHLILYGVHNSPSISRVVSYFNLF